MLPKGCIRKIESLCSKFLWSGRIDTHCNAKVAWSTVCLPKVEGGLGLRRIATWNTTLCLRFIWLLFSNSGSLWVAWQHHHHKLSSISFWDVKAKRSDSWFWKSLLKIRHLARMFLRCNIGNGSKAWFWHDSWTPFGSLLTSMGDDGPRNLRIPRNAKVADACSENGWLLASPRTDHALSLHIYLSSIQLPLATAADDSFEWVVENKPCEGFSSSKTSEVLRPRGATMSWTDLIWFKGSTPKHAFHM